MSFRELWVKGLLVPVVCGCLLLGVAWKTVSILNEPQPALKTALLATYGTDKAPSVEKAKSKKKSKKNSGKKKAAQSSKNAASSDKSR